MADTRRFNSFVETCLSLSSRNKSKIVFSGNTNYESHKMVSYTYTSAYNFKKTIEHWNKIVRNRNSVALC